MVLDLPFIGLPSQGWSPTLNSTVPPNPNSSDYCYSARIRNMVLQALPFSGIPTVLALNFMCFLVLLVVFSFLRTLRDHGRLALVTNAERKQDQHSVGIDKRDTGFWKWLISIYQIKDEEITEKCGEDAMHYLCFQRHVIGLLVVVCVLSVGIILPVNFSGKLLGDVPNRFGRTTIANLNTDNRILWLHTIFSFLYLLLTVFSMRLHTSKMQYKEDNLVKCTLFVNGIPKFAEESEIKQHFERAYENCVVLEACICYNVSRLMYLDSERKKMEHSKKFFLDLQAKENIITMVNPNYCRHLCCFSEQEEAVSYYTKMEAQLKEECKKEREKVTSKPLGMAFVTFQNESITATILKDFNACKCQGCSFREPKSSQFSHKLQTRNWTISYAPDPQNIYWEHLSMGSFFWWMRCFIINVVLFLILFFLTTPAIIMSTMDKYDVTDPVKKLNYPIIAQVFPTLLLSTFSVLLPTIVFYSAFLERHWTRSGENRTTMHKCYIFLIFMVLVLPSLGLGSLDIFFRWLFQTSYLEDEIVRFECASLPDSGAFYVNYVIAAAFIGNAMDLLRIPRLLVYMIHLCLARSAAERKIVKQQHACEFQFGVAYAWMMSVFTVVMTYSITCPIIVFFGLMYMVVKHLTDRYNIYYVYLPSKLDKKIHSGAVNQVVVAPILCLFWGLFFSTVRLGFSAATSMFTFIVLIITLIICLSHVCFGYFKYLSTHNYETVTQDVNGLEKGFVVDTSASNKATQKYIPEVLQDPNSEEADSGNVRLKVSGSIPGFDMETQLHHDKETAW
uniref:Uncharacterized protein n=1 Tax=Mola mola TaxID=94237 RepID=A0A3Q3X3S4_MOLML